MISFIVPAFSEERLLGATLDALHAAGREVGETYELIVVDDASTDRTAEIAVYHGARLVTVSHRQIAAARNAGAREAMGDPFVFVDADTIVNAAAVRGAMEAVRDGAAGGGATVEFDGTIPWWAKLLVPVLAWVSRSAGWAAGCFLFCTKRAFAAVGGFDETYFGAEEIFMSSALKRHGRFVVLRHSVISSGRKMRTHSGREILSTLLRLAIRGRQALKQREGMELWYAERRDDPEKSATRR